MIQDRFIVVLYLTATCNLNCRYCYIDKSPALQKIDELIEEIREIYLSKEYRGLMCWLINRAFMITPQSKSNIDKSASTTRHNRSILFKTLYTINPSNFLEIFSKNM